MIALAKSVTAGLYARPNLLLVATAFFWACNAIAGQLARGEITALQHVFLRWVIVTAIVWPFYGRAVMAHLHVLRQHPMKIAAMSMLGFTAFNIIFYVASFNTTAVNIGILQGSVPVIVVILAFLFRGTRITALQCLGVLLTLVGVALVATAGAPWLIMQIAFNFGDLMMLVACLSYATYAVMLQSRPPLPGAVFFTMMAPIAAITALPPLIWETATQDVAWPTLNGWLITVFVAIFPAILAQQFFTYTLALVCLVDRQI